MADQHELPVALLEVQQQLKQAQLQIAALEAQIGADRLPTPAPVAHDYHVLDNLLEGCQIIDFDWRYRYLNDSAIGHAQYPKAELLGYTMMERYPGIEQTAMFAVLQRCMQERTSANIENEFAYPDGSSAWFELRVQPIPEGLLIFSLNITARKQAEAAERESADWARLALTASNLGKWQRNLETGFIRFDETARCHYGFAQDTVTLPMLLAQVHPDDVARLRQEIAIILIPTGTGHYATEYRVIHPDGSVHWLAIQAQVHFRGEGETRQPYISYGTSQEITARKEAEDALKQYNQRLEILHQIDFGIIHARSLAEIIESALKQSRAFFACEQANLLLFDQTPQEVLLLAVDADTPTLIKEGDRYPMSPGFLAAFDIAPVSVIVDLQTLAPASPADGYVKQDGMRSSLRALLIQQGRPFGMLVFNTATPHYFTAEQQEIAGQIANQLAIVIHQRQLSDDLAQYVHQVEEMHQFLQATLDGFPANTAVLAPDGVILTVNQRWKCFADEQGAQPQDGYYLGNNYLTVCDRASGANSAEAAAAAVGIRAVIAGTQDEFSLEYLCQTAVPLWFLLRVTPFAEPAPRRVVVAHIDITERKRVEKSEQEQRFLAEAMRDSLAALTASGDVETTMQQILAYSATVIPGEAGTLVLYEGSQGHVAYFRGHSPDAEVFFRANRITLDTGLYPAGDDGQGYYLVTDTKTASDWRSFPVTAWVRSSMGVQIVVHGKPIGLLIADSANVGQFQQKDLANLQLFAHYAALALEKTQYVGHLEQQVQMRTAELQAAKERVEAILDNSADGILLIDKDLRIQQMNAAGKRLLAYPLAEDSNRTLSDFVEAQDANAITQVMRKVIVEAQAGHLEIRCTRSDGVVFDAELSMGLIKSDGLVCVMRDITERKAQERQLRYHASLQESVSDAVIVTDLTFRIQSWNRAAERIYGWRAEEVVGYTTPEILRTQFVRSDDYALSKQQLYNEDWWEGEVVQQHKDGTLRSILGSVTVVKDEQGRPFGVVAVNRDITERKAIEQALQQSAAEIFDLYNNAPCGYHALDQDGMFVQINDTELRWLGYDRADVVGKLKFTDLLIAESKEIFFRNFSLFKEQGWIKDLEFELVRKDGSTFFVLLNSTVLYDENGQYLRSRSTLFDITNLRQARQALVESEARYRLLANNVKDVIGKLSFSNGIRTFVTPSCYHLLGYTPDELIGQVALDLVHPDDREATVTAMMQALNNDRSSFEIVQRFRHKAGHYLWAEITNNIVREPETGTPLEIVGVIRDITERKRMEVLQQARAEEEREFQQYLRALHEITIELTQVNEVDAFYRRTVELGLLYFHLDRLAIFMFDQASGLACGAYGTDPHGNVVAEAQVQFTPAPDGLLNAALDSVERFSFRENVPLFYDHQIMGYGWNVATILWNGAERLGWLVADNLLTQKTATKPLLDILRLYALTVGALLVQKQAQMALRESEQRYRLLAENIADVVVSTNAALQFIYVSPSSRTVLGYEPAELLGQSALTYAHPDYWAITEQAISVATEQSMGDVSLVSRLRHKAGHYVWLEINGRAMRSGITGEIEGFVASARDISDRKQAEIALRESEEKFRLLLDSAPIATVISDQQGRITIINLQAEMLFGFTRAELVGQAVDLLVPEYARNTHPVNRTTYMAAPRVRQLGVGMEIFASRKDGSLFPVEIQLSYIETKDGIMIMSFVVDITERKQVAAELERQRSFLRSVIDVSPSMIFVKNYDSRFVLANPMIAQMYNTTVEAMVGKTDADFNPSAQEVAHFLAADRKVIDTGEQLFIEEPITNFAGETRWLQTTKVPIIGADGAAKYVLGIARDITAHKLAEAALKASEEKYRLLVETMRGGLTIFDLEERITYVNDRFCELLGYSRDELLGTQSYSYVDPSDAETINTQLQQRRNSASSSYEIVAKRKDGQPIYLLVSGSPLFDKHGEYQGSFAVTTDITVQKQAEETLRLALDKEKELGELKSRFISMASHEFRTPLATILALTETLSIYRHRFSEVQIEQRLNRIKEQIEHLREIMEDVLLLAQMQARRAKFNPVDLDLDALCRTILEEFQGRTDINHQLAYHAHEGDYTMNVDAKLMRQIISNLVSNAIKYSPAGTTVQLSLAWVGEMCVLQVRDEGIGIPTADLQHLFEPFHRAANVGAIAGTGLGLVIIKEAIELHNGAITVESQLGQGTTFTVHLPLIQ